MASTFVSAAKSVVQELSKNGELIPVDSLKSSTNFSPYSLLRKKTRSSLFWRSQYVWLNLALRDILDPSTLEPEVIQQGPFHFNDEVDGEVSGSVEVKDSVEVKISGQISESNKTTLEVKTLSVSPTTWDYLQKERKLKKPEPTIIQELRKREENLYVVTEAVKTQKETILKRSRNRAGFGKISIPIVSCVQGEGQGHLNTVKTVTVPEGIILGFQVAKLIIRDHWNKNQKTFPPKGSRKVIQTDFGHKTTVGTVMGFEELQAEVKKEEHQLAMLDKNLGQFLLRALLGLLHSEQDLLDLEDMLEQSLYTGKPPKMVEGKTDFLSNLQDHSGQLVEDIAGPFLYLLGALNALNDCQHQLLIQLLDKKGKILSQEVELVKEILKKNFNEREERPFSLPSELLSFVQQDQDENLTLTRDLLEECGLCLLGNEPPFTWNPNALHSLCALYGSLVMLQALTKV